MWSTAVTGLATPMPKWKTAAAEINLGGKERRYLGYSATIRTKTGKKPQKVTQFISLFPQIAFKQLMLYHNRVNQCFKCLSSAKVLNKRALHSWFILVWLRNREKKQGFFFSHSTAERQGASLYHILHGKHRHWNNSFCKKCYSFSLTHGFSEALLV